MKKSLIALAALGAFAGAASAQSSVTLFGILDTGIRAVKNGDGSTVKSLTNDGLAASRIGFRGEEDLGGGLKAAFWIESGVGLDVGSAGSSTGVGVTGTPGASASQAAKFFNRRATIGLLGPFGEVRLGRDYVPTFSNLSAFDSYGAVGVGSVLNLMGASGAINGIGPLGSGAGTLVRADNSVAYFLPGNIGGVYGTVMAAMGEGTNATNGNNGRYVGGRVGYAAGPLNVAGAYGRTRIPGQDDFRVWNVGASFALPVVKVSALYHRAEFQPNSAANIQQKLWAVGLNVPIGQAELRATYQRSDLGGGVAGSGLTQCRRRTPVRCRRDLQPVQAHRRVRRRGPSTKPWRLGVDDPGWHDAWRRRIAGRDSTALAVGVRHGF